MKHVPKVWGAEIWIVNEEYCAKFLIVDKGARCSYHKHLRKKETFYCFIGKIMLTVEGAVTIMEKDTEPVTILPKQFHSFEGIEKSIILEVSTHHEDSDVVRLTESKGA